MSVLNGATTTIEGLAAPEEAASPSKLRDHFELTKPRLNSLVLLTTGVGYVLAAPQLGWAQMLALLHTLIGTALCAGSGGVMNQWMEREIDGRMVRTADRPLPAGRVHPDVALRFGAVLGVAGVAYLALLVNPLTAALALATIVSYALVYTPMKRFSSIATIVGGVPGALPFVMGWTAARNAVEWPAIALFLILFVWQMPHFLAIAWACRDDYARGGLPMLPVVDPTGFRTSAAIFTWSALLVPVSIFPVMLGLLGGLYLVGAVVLGLVNFAFALSVIRHRTVASARRLFFWSIVYLPILLALMTADGLLGRTMIGG